LSKFTRRAYDDEQSGGARERQPCSSVSARAVFLSSLGAAFGSSAVGTGAGQMPTTLNAAIESYLRAKNLSRGTRNEYRSTLRKWEAWGAVAPIEELQRKNIREFLDWVHERAIAQEGTNPGRTANKAREHLRAVLSWAWEQELIGTLPRFPIPREQRDVAGGTT
jgi:hypothetical protein